MQPQHDLVLEVSSPIHGFIKGLEAGVWQELRQPPRPLGPPQFHFFPYLSTDQIELLICQPVLPDQSGEGGYQFRLLTCRCEGGERLARHASYFTPKQAVSFAFWQFCEIHMSAVLQSSRREIRRRLGEG